MAFINDIVLMEQSTRVWLPEVELGTPMIGGLTPVLSSIVGPKRAIEMIVMGEDWSPGDLKLMGLVNRVAAGEPELDNILQHYATRIAAQPENALHSVKIQFQGLYHREQLGNMTGFDADLALVPSLRSKARKEQPTGLMSERAKL